MNITMYVTDWPTQTDWEFIDDGFKAGLAEGAYPSYRAAPTGGEMAAIAVGPYGPVGFATFYLAGDPERVWLDVLWVRPEARRLSIGTRIVGAVLAYGERNGIAVEFGTSVTNIPMQNLAESLGINPQSIGYRKEPVGA